MKLQQLLTALRSSLPRTHEEWTALVLRLHFVIWVALQSAAHIVKTITDLFGH